jgi:hypothetical protein
MEIYDLEEYKYAKKFVEDMKSVRKILYETHRSLHKHRNYMLVKEVMDSIEWVMEKLSQREQEYKGILDAKGKKSRTGAGGC